MQTNTKILAKEFEYLAPKTLDEALNLLDKYKDKNIKILAGGTDLLVKMKTTDLQVDYLLNIKNIPELDFYRYNTRIKIRSYNPFISYCKRRKSKNELYCTL